MNQRWLGISRQRIYEVERWIPGGNLEGGDKNGATRPNSEVLNPGIRFVGEFIDNFSRRCSRGYSERK